MRAFLLLLALPLAAAAEPSLRWIDRFGDVREAQVKEVLVESGASVHVRTRDGSTLEVPLRRLLSMVRERERVPREKALLRARLDAAAGERLDEARPVLDKIIADADAPAWMRQYAAAARALLAERAREADAAERIDAFLAGDPRSRFASELFRARARVRSRAAKGDKDVLMAPYREAYDAIEKAGGPQLQRCLCLLDAVEHVLARDPGHFPILMQGFGNMLIVAATGSEDVGDLVLAKSVNTWAELRYEMYLAGVQREGGRKPIGRLDRVRILLGRAGLDLPETRCDLHLAYGRLLLECDEGKEAPEHFERALALAPDLRRRAAARAALDATKPPKKG